MLSILMKSLTFLNKRTGKSDCRLYSCVRIIIMNFYFGDSWSGRSDIWGGISPLPPFCMKHCISLQNLKEKNSIFQNTHFQTLISTLLFEFNRLQYTLAAPEVFMASANPVSLPSGYRVSIVRNTNIDQIETTPLWYC